MWAPPLLRPFAFEDEAGHGDVQRQQWQQEEDGGAYEAEARDNARSEVI